MQAKVLALIFVPLIAHASTKEKFEAPSVAGAKYKHVFNVENPPEEALMPKTTEAMISTANEKRKPADFALSTGMQTLSSELQQLKTGDELEALLNKYADPEFNKTLTPDVQYFTLELGLLRPYRGFFPRLRPLLEGENQAVHSAAVSMIKSMSETGQIYFPGEEWSAVNEYLTVPSEKSPQPAFKSIPEFQDFLANKVAPLMSQTRNKMVLLIQARESNDNGPFIFDNKAIYGIGTFEGDEVVDRYTEHDFPEMWTAASRISMGLHLIYSFCAYNLNDGLKAYGSLASLYGKNAISFLTNRDDLGVSSRDRTKAVRKYPRFLTIRTENASNATAGAGSDPRGIGYRLMARSLTELRAAQAYSKKAWVYLARMKENPHSLIDPGRFKAKQLQERYALNIKNIDGVLAGAYPVHSPITGKTVSINVPEFFTNPPADIKTLMPISWDQHPKEAYTQNKKLPYRYFKAGSATGWDNAAWAPYVKVSGDSSAMKENLRTLRLSWGMKFVSRPIDTVLR
jgi:hypothetical protein